MSISYSMMLLKYDNSQLKNIPSYGICIFTELSFICLLITLEYQMMEDGILCVLKLCMSVFQSCFNMHNVLTDLAQWGPIAALTAIWTYTTSLVTCSILCTLSTCFPTALAIGITWTSWKTKKHELFMHIIWKGLRWKSKIPYFS